MFYDLVYTRQQWLSEVIRNRQLQKSSVKWSAKLLTQIPLPGKKNSFQVKDVGLLLEICSLLRKKCGRVRPALCHQPPSENFCSKKLDLRSKLQSVIFVTLLTQVSDLLLYQIFSIHYGFKNMPRFFFFQSCMCSQKLFFMNIIGIS